MSNMQFKTPTIYTITELTTAIKNNLESAYRFIKVRGEISNLSTPYSGHSYFVIKDTGAQIRAVIFKNQKRFLSAPITNGKEVICHGRISVYEPRGEYQIIIDSIEDVGHGLLNRQFEETKKTLTEKGYFSSDIKKEIPSLASKIIVITSATGAAIQDLIKMHTTLGSNCNIQILPVPVQGKFASKEIAGAIIKANTLNVDCIVLCRGGGSIEDLWAFNELEVAEAIFKSKTPIISAVGHETDFTISDFCADMRVATPTAAAELLFQDNNAIALYVKELLARQLSSFQRMITKYEQELRGYRKTFYRTTETLQKLDMRLSLSKLYFVQAIKKKIAAEEHNLHDLSNRLVSESPLTKVNLNQERLKNLHGRLMYQIQSVLDKKSQQFSSQLALLDSVSPLATIARGYSITRTINRPNNSVVTRVEQVNQGEQVSILVSNGELNCIIDKITKNKS
ncbi:MAG: exodeoxyribonuclease VII large subunit [Desulfotalea sp.]